MTKSFHIGVMLAILTLLACGSPFAGEAFEFFSLSKGTPVSAETFTAALAEHRFILVGERHTVERHHAGQLEVIRRLVSGGLPVAIGMEMMRSDSQDALDAWVAGRMSEAEFKAVYEDNWTFPWRYYRPIFVFAREHRIPIIGLNVPREITRQVAREGFDSLSPSQRQGLPFVTCQVDEDYLAFIRDAYGAHSHGNMAFENFCEAQLVWDKAMAVTAARYAEKTPERRIVILTGTGHARKGGIPRQLQSLGHNAYQVVLPEIPTLLDPQTLDGEDADFLLRAP